MPGVSLKGQLSISREWLLPYSNGKFDIIEISDYDSWKQGSYSNGCPLVKAEGANYLTPTPSGAISIGETTIRHLQTHQAIDIAFRRWIAQRAAMMFYDKGDLSESDCMDLLTTYTPQESWTKDAIIAVQALLRERRELGQREGEIPGFMGPDEWFAC
jgi:hypothetical protein